MKNFSCRKKIMYTLHTSSRYTERVKYFYRTLTGGPQKPAQEGRG